MIENTIAALISACSGAAISASLTKAPARARETEKGKPITMSASYGFSIHSPAEIRVPFVFNSPHSGRIYPPSFLSASRLSPLALRKSEDFLIDELFASIVPTGAPLLCAEFPRAWLDVNREPYELDPEMFDGPLPYRVNSGSARVVGGLGTIARIVSETDAIYPGQLPVSEAVDRIENYYKPYHAELRGLLSRTIVRFGHAILIDCHSMPSVNMGGAKRRRELSRADFVLGDRFGTACAPQLTRTAAELLRNLGYRVAINKPYAGGFITEHYGRPQNGLHALQIEINRSLYMNEQRMEKSSGFNKLERDLATFVSRLVSIPESGFEAIMPLAAE